MSITTNAKSNAKSLPIKHIVIKSVIQSTCIFCLFIAYHLIFTNQKIKDMQVKQDILQEKIDQLEEQIDIDSLRTQMSMIKTQHQEIIKNTNQDESSAKIQFDQNSSLIQEISKLMGNCKDQICQTNHKLSSANFLKLYEAAESKISFFFLNTETNLSKDQWNEKKMN